MNYDQDPYRVLGLPHTATPTEIKMAYHRMARKYHPDRFVSATTETQQAAAAHFAEGSAAYTVLSDPQRKATYDHIYKYGGYDIDEMEEEAKMTKSKSEMSQQQQQHRTKNSLKRKTGIGYNCIDPFAYVWTHGRIHSRRTTAGIEIPARLNHLHSLRVAISSGQVVSDPTSGSKTCVSHTRGYVQGKKFCRTERITYHPDGRREVVITEGKDASADPYLNASVCHHGNDKPWYQNAWQEIRDKLSMCYNPCAVVTSQ